MPDRQGLVLLALILVAAVANLNLAVANVALPDIGKAFNASQSALDLVAVGYSLGLASSVLYLGALGDRYGRKMMLILGTFLAIPASILAASAEQHRRADRGAHPRRPRGRHGLPDHAGPDHGAVVRPGTDQVDRALVGPRSRDLLARAARVGRPARASRVGVGLPAHAAAGGHRAHPRDHARTQPRQRGHRPGRQPRRDPLGRRGLARSFSRSTSRPSRTRARWRSASAPSRSRPSSASSCASGEPASRSMTSRLRRGASSGSPRWPGSSCSAA